MRILKSSVGLVAILAAGCTGFWEVPATPLQEAAWKGDVTAIRSLVQAGADINQTDNEGGTALSWAARGGHALGPHQCRGEAADRPEVIRTLLALGANPNMQDTRPEGFGRSSRWTPLFVAIHHEQFKSAAVLLEGGADPNVRTGQGRSIMEFASVERVRFVLRILQPGQAGPNQTRKLLRMRRLLCEDISGTCEAIKRRRGGHLPIQSPRVSAARAPA